MTEQQSPAEQSSRDRIIEDVVEKVEQRASMDVSREEIEARAGEAVDDLADKPVQTFTPLLAENQVVGGLMAEKQGQRATDE